MSRPIIEVKNLSKVYQLGTIGATRLKDEVALLWDRIRGQHQAQKKGEFRALRDVSFEVQPGEVVGIIGRNGAGKSTLLKILSRITQQTAGEITLRGRVASLLEVGTGFHPDLTGRENIFLNGAILGMTRAEIRRKLDEIIAFAEVEQFIDTPVKRYSSGMYVRLAFAVAAHLEPEILIVDEVLAVGDFAFQKKCLGKMGEVSRRDGRTVLFVSHNLFAVRDLCTRAILLENGGIAANSDVETALECYSGKALIETEAVFKADPDKPSITRVAIDSNGLKRGDIIVDISFESPFPLSPPIPGIVISTKSSMPVYGSNPRFHAKGFEGNPLKGGTLRMTAMGLPLHGGTYHLSVWLGDWHTNYDHLPDLLTFDFKNDEKPSLIPRIESIGALKWDASWRSLEVDPPILP